MNTLSLNDLRKAIASAYPDADPQPGGPVEIFENPALTVPVHVIRPWRERLFSWPWRPWRRLRLEHRPDERVYMLDRSLLSLGISSPLSSGGKMLVAHPVTAARLREHLGDEAVQTF